MKNDAPDFKKIGQQLIADIPRYASVTALNFFKDSFIKQGWEDVTFEPWKGRKDASDTGRAILVNTAYLQNELRIARADRKAIQIVNDAPYAAIHNEGGNISIAVTERMRKYFWAMWYATGENRYKAMALMTQKRITFTMPKRQFMGHSATMMNQMENWLLNQIKTRFKAT